MVGICDWGRFGEISSAFSSLILYYHPPGHVFIVAQNNSALEVDFDQVWQP